MDALLQKKSPLAGMIITLQLAYINIHLHTISAVPPGERFGSICVTSVASSRPHAAEVAADDSERGFYDPLLFREVTGVFCQAEAGANGPAALSNITYWIVIY